VKPFNIRIPKEKFRWKATIQGKKQKIAKINIKNGEWKQKSNLSQLRFKGFYEEKSEMDSFSLCGEWVDNDCKKGVIDLKSEIEKEVIQEERSRMRREG
jgi:hypothetical protein